MFCIKRLATIMAALFLVFVLPINSAWAARSPKAKDEPAAGPVCKSSILVEVSSGQVLSEVDARTPLPPASMVKMMVAYLAMKRVENGSVKLTDVITASAHASKIGGSQVYLRQGEQFTLAQLLEAVMIHSANDASFAIAEYLGGSEEGFVEMMNAEAEALEMKDTKFYSPHGLPPAKDQHPDLSSAFDLSILARALITKYPEVLEWSSKPIADFRDGKFQMTNTNHLVRNYPGADGLKTGYYVGAGFCVTATAKRNDVRMLAVVMGCNNGKRRFSEAARLLSQGFAQYKVQKLVDKGVKAKTAVGIAGGTESQIIPVTASEVTYPIKVTGDKQQVTQKESLCSGLKAPVAANTKCGELSFLIGEKEVAKVDFVVPRDIPEGGMLDRVKVMLRLK